MSERDRMCELTLGGEILYFADPRDLLAAVAVLARGVRSTCRAEPGKGRRQAIVLQDVECRVRMPRSPLAAAQVRDALGARACGALRMLQEGGAT